MSITRPMLATVNGHPEPMRISLRWDSRRPFEVHMNIFKPGMPSYCLDSWKFALDLLVAGVLAPSGIGDVRVAPAGLDDTLIVLQSPDGRAELVVSTAELEAFLRETWIAEPPALPDYIPAEFFEATP